MNSSLAPMGPLTRNSLMIKPPAARADGRTDQRFFPLPSPSPTPVVVFEPFPVEAADELAGLLCLLWLGSALIKNVSLATAGVRVGGVTMIGTLCRTGA